MKIEIIQSFDSCAEFIADFYDDPVFSDPMLSDEQQRKYNLVNAINQPKTHRVLGVYLDERMVGLFSFSTRHDEEYTEMLVGLSRMKAAYEVVFQYLVQNFPGFEADFVFNPSNYLIKELLESKNAEFEPEQQKMLLCKPYFDVDTTDIVPFCEEFAQQYYSMHCKDVYWVGEKVAAAQDRFRIFLAIRDSKVVGYLDTTYRHETNEIFDFFVLQEHRRLGYGRKLLAKALEMNRPNGMELVVDTDNLPAISLYESMGFCKEANKNSMTAHLILPTA